jgi:HTH-type transcriptional regulator/antitoxin HigA
MVTSQTLHSDICISPGEYLVEVLDDLGMTKDELAKRMNRPAPKLSAIFKGDKAITPDTALQLEKVVGVPAHIWTGLESEYRLTLARQQQAQEQQRLKTEVPLVSRFRYADLTRLGKVPKKTRAVDKVLELQKFFGVTSLSTVPDLKRYQVAFRRSKTPSKIKAPEGVAAWLRIGEREAQSCRCAPFDRKELKACLSTVRSMTLQKPEQFQDALNEVFAGAGVALVLCPEFLGTGINGATFWMGPDRAVVMMTLRYKWADIFWFSLFHELGHILLHGQQTVILESAHEDPALNKQENEANRFAAETLVPPADYRAFLSAKHFYAEDIQKFAGKVGIAAGVVVGRLQHDGHLRNNWHNGLRVRFQWKVQ